jgi:Tfp pilus assembly protein PilE
MKGGASPRGYTIVEVMIFLAVTGALLVSALAIFSGQEGRTEFATGAREMESRMQDIINDVATGFYARSADFTCRGNSGAPLFTPPSAEQGTNQDCIFIGRAMHFDLDGSAGAGYNVYSIAGLRQAGSGALKHEVKDFAEAQPRAIVNPPAPVDSTQNENLPPGLRFGKMYYRQNPSSAPQYIDGVSFFSSFSKYTASSLQPGTMTVSVVPLQGGGAAGSSSKATIASQIEGLGASAVPANIDPNGGVVICFDSTSGGQYAELFIGGFRGHLTTNLDIKVGSCP